MPGVQRRLGLMPRAVSDSWKPVMADFRAVYAVITAQALPELRDSAVRSGIWFAYNFKSLRCNDAAVNVQTAAP